MIEARSTTSRGGRGSMSSGPSSSAMGRGSCSRVLAGRFCGWRGNRRGNSEVGALNGQSGHDPQSRRVYAHLVELAISTVDNNLNSYVCTVGDAFDAREIQGNTECAGSRLLNEITSPDVLSSGHTALLERVKRSRVLGRREQDSDRKVWMSTSDREETAFQREDGPVGRDLSVTA